MSTNGAVVNHMQAGYDIIGQDTGGFSVRFYVFSVSWGVNDDQRLIIDGSNGVHYEHSYHASSPNNGSVMMTYVDIGFPAPPGGVVAFQAVVTDVSFGTGQGPRVDGQYSAACAPPNPPSIAFTNVTATNLGVYTTAAGAENGCGTDAVNYRLYRDYDGAHMGDIQGGYGGVNFGGLTPGTAYHAHAQSHNAAGWGSFSGAIFGSTAAAPPGTPGVSVDQVTATSARVNVSPAAPNGAGVDAYETQVLRTSDNADMGTQGGGTATWTNLARATGYYARSRAHNAAGWGPYSGNVPFTTLPSIPSAPTITGVSSITPTSAAVSWSPPADNGGQTITAYEVDYSTDNFATKVTQSTGTLSNLTPGAVYQVRVRALNASGAGPYSSTVVFTTQTGMKVYNGTAFIDAPVYAYNGTAFVACEVRIYNGTAWVPTG